MADSETEIKPRPRTASSVVLLAAYVAIVGWSFYEESTSWPHEGSWATLAYVFLCPGIVFQSFALVYARITGRALARRALARVVTIPLGLMIAVLMTGLASAFSMSAFEEAYAPFAAQVGANLADPCGPALKYFAIPVVAAYNDGMGRRPTASLKYDSKRFVLSFPGGSFDMDGSTIYYDSGARQWRKFHNDSTIASREFEKLTEGLAECRLSSAPLPQ